MSWIATAIIGTGLVTAYTGYQASKNAANSSQAATDAATGEQAREFNQTQQNMQPFLQGGTNAFNNLQQQTQNYTPQSQPTLNYNGQVPNYTPNPSFSFDSSNLANDPAYKFAYDQAMQSVDRGSAATGMFNSGNRALALQDQAAGLASQQYQNAFNNALQGYNVNTANNLNNYQVTAGNEATNYNRALTNYGINLGNTQNSYNQYQDYLNRLAAQAGIGQSTAGTLGSIGANSASNIGNAYLTNATNQGNAAALQYGSFNNAVQGGVGNYLGYLQNQQLLSKIPQAATPVSTNAFYTWNG